MTLNVGGTASGVTQPQPPLLLVLPGNIAMWVLGPLRKQGEEQHGGAEELCFGHEGSRAPVQPPPAVVQGFDSGGLGTFLVVDNWGMAVGLEEDEIL